MLCAAWTAKPMTSTAQNNAAPRMISLRQVSQNALTGPSLLRIRSILAGRTAVREVGFRARDGARRSGVMLVKVAEAPLERSGNGLESGGTRLGTAHGRAAQDLALGRRSPRSIASGLDCYGIERSEERRVR